MITYISVNDVQEVDLEFDEDNCEKIFDKFKKWNDKAHRYSNEELNKLNEALDMLSNYPNCFNVEALVDEVEVSEDDIAEAYEDIHGTSSGYDDGYEDAMTERNRCRSAVETHYGLLMQKLERLAYGYGNPEPLTRDEIRKIKDLLDGLTS